MQLDGGAFYVTSKVAVWLHKSIISGTNAKVPMTYGQHLLRLLDPLRYSLLALRVDMLIHNAVA